MQTIWMADDDARLTGMVGEYLHDAGFTFEAYPSGDAVLHALLETQTQAPDALILDVMMPGTDGLQTCQRLRHALPALPILMLTAKGDPLDRIIGLELGADDYFVLGDNRNNSSDSREPSVGNIHRDQIIGKAWVRIWPFHKFGVLKHQ